MNEPMVILGLSVVLGLSVAAGLLRPLAVGDRLTCIVVHNGLPRSREAEVEQEVFGRNFMLQCRYGRRWCAVAARFRRAHSQ